MAELDKVQVARRQLGTALALFLADCDPVSVHCLACGGGEVAETLTAKAGAEPFSSHIFATQPQVTPKALKEMRNLYWNAFKHASTRDGVERADLEEMAHFSDDKNDHVLFIAWHDYMMATRRTPIEAQAFQAWYFALYPEKLDPKVPTEIYETIFPGLTTLPRTEQKAMLRQVIEREQNNPDTMGSPLTDPDPLALGAL